MATYVIGDLHGCFQTFLELLQTCEFHSEKDRLWFVGDLVNKGPESLEVLRWVRRRSHLATLVLGNHDLHLLGRYYGVRQAKASDTLDPVLEADDIEQLVELLIRQPLIHREGQQVLVHAGILPAWDPDQAIRLALEASRLLVSDPVELLGRLNEKTERKNKSLAENDLSKSWIVRILTGIRICRGPSDPNIEFTGPPSESPLGTRPWYRFHSVARGNIRFFFGHWAQHGFMKEDRAVCLDTGCVYGGSLTAFRLDDEAVFQVPSRESF